ncbi:MAG: hypothetical protein HXY30_03215 [Pseudorhodoplanes sp.]|nr:hypothetical protein [Pseudorhodoplanes sp.]
MLERIDRKIGNMGAMLRRVGIDRAALARYRRGAWFTAAMRACQACPNTDICSMWLDCAPDRIERVPEFCPNALRFENAKAAMGGNPHVS